MAGSPPKKFRMFEDDIEYDDIDIESESDGESDSDNEEDVLEVDDHEGKELLKNFLEMSSQGGGKRNEFFSTKSSVENVENKSLETKVSSTAITDFVLEDVKKVNEENLRLLEEVQEMGDELREKNKIIEQQKEIAEVSIEKIKELTKKEEDAKVLQNQNRVLQEELKVKDDEMLSLKSQLKMYDMLSSNYMKKATETAAEMKNLNMMLEEKEKDVTTLKSILNQLELSCQLKLEKAQDSSLALKEKYKKFAEEYERKAEQMLNMITVQNEVIKRLKLKDRPPTESEGEGGGRGGEIESGDENLKVLGTNTKETNKQPPGPSLPSGLILSRPHHQNLLLVGPPGPPSTSTRVPPGPSTFTVGAPGLTELPGNGTRTKHNSAPGSTKNLIGPPGPSIVPRSKSPPGPPAIHV